MRSWSTNEIDVEPVLDAIARDGFAVVPEVLSVGEVDDAVERLWEAAEESRRRGVPTYIPFADPNEQNVRISNLVDLDPLFGDLLEHPVAEAILSRFLEPDYIVSGFTANIARPGSGSMVIHSDQFLAPEPWADPWALNLLWFLSDARRENGSTLYLPGSHRITSRAELPAEITEISDRMQAFEAPRGSVIAMDARMWHTSGENRTDDEDRPLLLAYYSKQFVRPQVNFSISLAPRVQQRFSERMRYRLGLEPMLNIAGTAQRVATLSSDPPSSSD